MKNKHFISEPDDEKKRYNTPNLILYGEISQITAGGSQGDPEGAVDDSFIDEPVSYYE